MASILTSVKKLLGIAEDYVHFDQDIIMNINSVLSILTQLGVGSKDGFFIIDKNTMWNDYILDNNKIEFIKTYIYLKVKLSFDPPTSSSAIESINRQIAELEWRIQLSVDPINMKEEIKIE